MKRTARISAKLGKLGTLTVDPTQHLYIVRFRSTDNYVICKTCGGSGSVGRDSCKKCRGTGRTGGQIRSFITFAKDAEQAASKMRSRGKIVYVRKLGVPGDNVENEISEDFIKEIMANNKNVKNDDNVEVKCQEVAP